MSEINTPQGTFPSVSPFLNRPWTWGYAGMDIDVSRNEMTMVVGKTSRPKVSLVRYGYVA